MKKEEILLLLREKNGYLSGQELCEHFHVSRTAVWKAMKQLKSEGYQIESVQNKGYYLVNQETDLLSEVEIRSRLHTKWAGNQVVFKEETGSTNNDCKLLAESGAKAGLLVVADTQTGGKGRRGRVWQSPKGTAIAMSLLLRPDYIPDVASQITLVMALAMVKAIEKVTGLEPKIKWPNDIVICGKKVVGILTEMSTEPGAINHVVVGTGVNVNMDCFSDEIQSVATSLKIETGHVVSRAEIVAEAMGYFEEFNDIFERNQNLSGLKEMYNSNLVSIGKEVRVLDPNGEFSGISQGINDIGELLVTKYDGSVETIYAGEVSVRGIYGYV